MKILDYLLVIAIGIGFIIIGLASKTANFFGFIKTNGAAFLKFSGAWMLIWFISGLFEKTAAFYVRACAVILFFTSTAGSKILSKMGL